MDTADTDSEDVDDPIILIDSEQNRSGCYISKERASYKQLDGKGSEGQDLITNNENWNDPETINIRRSRFKQNYKCYPVSIKLVDCEKYPWYYKLEKKLKPLKDNIEKNKIQEELEPDSSDSDVDDIICLNPICEKHKVMHNPNANAAKVSRLFDDKKISTVSNVKSNGNNIAVEYSGAKDRIGINFKKNIGLIGMRVRRRISIDEIIQTGDKINNNDIRANSVNSADFIKVQEKDVNTPKPMFKENESNRNEASQFNLKENIINEETSLNCQVNSPVCNGSKLETNSSPILQINCGNNKVKKYPIKLTTNVSGIDNTEKISLSGRLPIKRQENYINNSRLSETGTMIGLELKKSPILTIHSNKLSSTLESRTKSPVFLCENNTTRKISKKLPRREISANCLDAISGENDDFFSVKKNVVHEKDRVLEKKQKQTCLCIKDCKKNNIQTSGKLNNIIKNLHKRKLEQEVDSVSSEITNAKEKAQLTKNSAKNNYNIDKVKKNTSTYRTNHKENNTTNNLSLTNINSFKSCISPVLLSQSQNFVQHKLKCNFKQCDKNSIACYFDRRQEKHFKSLSASRKIVRRQIPHKHIRIPPVSSVLLNYRKFQQALPGSYIPKKSISLDVIKKTEASYATFNLKNTVIKPKFGNISQNNVQRTEATKDNEFLNQKNAKNISQNKVQGIEATKDNEFMNQNNKRNISRNNVQGTGATKDNTFLNQSSAENISQNNVQRTKETRNQELLSQDNQRKGYSPPILPIPTYHTTFEYLARFSSGELQRVEQNSHDFRNQKVLDSIMPTSTKFCVYTGNSGWKDFLGKRKFDTKDVRLISLTEKRNGKKKKISLTEYKRRIDDLGYARIYEFVGNKSDNGLQDSNLYLSSLRCLKNATDCNLESDNLGYDSDSTLRL